MRFVIAICVFFFLTLTACNTDPCDKYDKTVKKCVQNVQSLNDVLKCKIDVAPLKEACTAQKEVQEATKLKEFKQSEAYYKYEYKCTTNVQVDNIFDPDINVSYNYTLQFESTPTNQTAIFMTYTYNESMRSQYIDVSTVYIKGKEVRFKAEHTINGIKSSGFLDRGYDGDNVKIMILVNRIEPCDYMYEAIAFDSHYAVPHNGKSNTYTTITSSCTPVEL